MKLRDILTPSFKSIGEELGLKVEIFEGRLVIIPHRWRQALSVESEFCKALVATGMLTEKQMQRAALRYRLGATKSGGVIYWQIDNHEEIYEGKIMHYLPNCHRNKARKADWVGAVLSRRHGWEKGTSRHCFFGLHLLKVEGGNKTIAIVEAEKTAVILSEIYPQYIWLAAGGLTQLQLDKFRPLRGRHLILFPDTDPKGDAYKLWYDTAQTVQQQLFWENTPPIEISALLELKASEDQKARKIDLADYYFETIKPSLENSATIHTE